MKRATVNDSPVNVRLPLDLHAAVVERARVEDRTIAQTIRVALRFYLAETTPHAPAPAARPDGAGLPSDEGRGHPGANGPAPSPADNDGDTDG